ncbi:bile salt-activated lipase-like isoform X1 [Helicoverpa armigera]|uniref:bile salt-activated lipase-like isoform X1 n=1 Tax=Helicoverpa armigera TaxID=29058 RepID=UPI003082D14C
MKCGKRIVLFTLFAMNLVDQPAPEVTIEQGTLSGKISTDGSFFEYVGIPYATTNSSTRFKAPLPPPKWKGVYKAVDEMYQCPQHTPFGVVGTEDCLKINVYVPSETKGPLPVMVYIHGGGFILGNGGKMIVGPDFLVKQDVILVSFNYRLGALGFLCLGIEEAPGTVAGLKDQIAALRWVKKNIAAFGGDPDNVTIFGTSAGGTSVSLLVASPATNGLFQRAIVHSGSSLANWAINIDPIGVASTIVSRLGYDTKDPQKLYEIYSELSYKDLVLATANIPITHLVHKQLLLLPCVEKNFIGVESVLNDLPSNLITKKPIKNISLMYSSTDKEGWFFADEETKDTLEIKDQNSPFEEDLVFKSKKEENALALKVKQHYFGKEAVSEKTILQLSDLYTHLYFEMPIILELELMVKTSDAPVYSFYFTHSGKRNFVKSRTRFVNEIGASHGDDLMYIFKGSICPYRIEDKDQRVIEWITTLLTNFAKYGNPTPNDSPVRWIPHSKDKLNFLNIGDELKMIGVPNPEAYHLWKDIIEKHRRIKVA